MTVFDCRCVGSSAPRQRLCFQSRPDGGGRNTAGDRGVVDGGRDAGWSATTSLVAGKPQPVRISSKLL